MIKNGVLRFVLGALLVFCWGNAFAGQSPYSPAESSVTDLGLNPAAHLVALNDMAAPIDNTGTGAGMLQFKAGGHILGFQPDKAYLAGLDHALTVEFLGTSGVTPVSDSKDTAAMGNARASALGVVHYRNLWKNITLTYEASKDGIAESTYHVAPGGNVSDIRLRYNAPVTFQADGTLKFGFKTGEMVESAPVAWQEIGKERVPVTVAFRVSDGEVGFKVGRYDRNYPLVIDPTFSWNTFYGSVNDDAGIGIAVDSSGNVYVTGVSYASWGDNIRHPFAGSGYNIFVLKLSAAGVYQWNTFYASGGNSVMGGGIAVDSSGNVYVTGYSIGTWGSPLHDFTGSAPNIFVLKLNTDGGYLWHTFYGSGTGNGDVGYGIAVDSSGNVYVTGYSSGTWGLPLNPFTGSGTNIFVLKLNTDGVYQWHTFYGSVNGDAGAGIAVDSSGNVYVTGISYGSWGTPLNPFTGSNNFNIFVLKLSNAGDYQWNTFYASGNYNAGAGIAVDSSGNVYVTGMSSGSWGTPLNPFTASPNYPNIFVLKLSAAGHYQWNTFYASGNFLLRGGIAVDSSGNVYVTGMSYGTWGSPLNPFTGNYTNMFALKLSNAGDYQWNTFYGSGTWNGDLGAGIAVDSSGNVYVTGQSAGSWGSPIHSYSGGYDACVFKLAQSVPPPPPSPPCEISITPFTQNVTSDAGTTSFNVSNAGVISTVSWTAEVLSGGDWLTITSGASGTDAGTITCAFTANTSTLVMRSAYIRIVTTDGECLNYMMVNQSQLTATSTLLWTNSDGTASVWNLDDGGNLISSHSYGPFEGWTANSFHYTRFDASYGISQMLWDNTDGTALIWYMDQEGDVAKLNYGPYAGWAAAVYHLGKDGTSRMLWNNTDGTASIWTLDVRGNITHQMHYGPVTDAVGTWTAVDYRSNSDGTAQMLWSRSDGYASVWTLDSSGAVTDKTYYGPYASSVGTWFAKSYFKNSDGTAQMLWSQSGYASVWTLDSSGNMTSRMHYGPNAGWTPQYFDRVGQ